MKKLAKQLINESDISITALSEKLFGKKSYLSNALNTNNNTLLTKDEREKIAEYLKIDVQNIDFSKMNNAPFQMKGTPVTARENLGNLKNLEFGRLGKDVTNSVKEGKISRLVLLELLEFSEINSQLSVFGAMSELTTIAIKENKFLSLFKWFDSGEFTQSTFAFLWEHIDMTHDFLELKFKY